jgi:hypothetical protein
VVILASFCRGSQGGCHFFTGFLFNTHTPQHFLSLRPLHPEFMLATCDNLRHGGDENDCVRMVNSGSHFPRPLCAPKARVTVL